jgi:hypothetical protein
MRRMKALSQLNMSCTLAQAKALLKPHGPCSLQCLWNMKTSGVLKFTPTPFSFVLVTVRPKHSNLETLQRSTFCIGKTSVPPEGRVGMLQGQRPGPTRPAPATTIRFLVKPWLHRKMGSMCWCHKVRVIVSLGWNTGTD